MDVSKMKQIVRVSPHQFEECRDYLVKGRKVLEETYAAVESQVLNNQIYELFDQHFGHLGQIQEIHEVFGGYTNRSFGVLIERDGQRTDYFVRKYKAEATDNDVAMEHALIAHVLANGFEEAAGIYPTADGRTFVRLNELKNGKTVSRVFTVYRFLRGLDKYTWIENKSTPREFVNLGALLARYHKAAATFVPADDQRKTEPKVRALIPDFVRIFKQRAAQPLETLFHANFNAVLPAILGYMERFAVSPEEYGALLEVPVHGDYHAGNVKFDGEETVGLFDFDWSKVDARIFDVCLGLVYCCGSWDMENDGALRLEDCRNFVRGYNGVLKDAPALALSPVERRVFVRMLAGAHFYLIYWLTELWYYLDADNINSYEALSYLTHFLRGLNWLETNAEALQEIVGS
ncbi:MAG: phosphotransferase [Deltaproteobacteria bacterium]|jgi:homoserine kinase type II|nr:phosphotransferase [Deltaproteobacteria bacterium]